MGTPKRRKRPHKGPHLFHPRRSVKPPPCRTCRRSSPFLFVEEEAQRAQMRFSLPLDPLGHLDWPPFSSRRRIPSKGRAPGLQVKHRPDRREKGMGRRVGPLDFFGPGFVGQLEVRSCHRPHLGRRYPRISILWRAGRRAWRNSHEREFKGKGRGDLLRLGRGP